ncbi:MAG: hypothetical protein LBT93_05510 [Treponema sp.]|jgi:hypothetical protein|nr:hypothetical protein [Treponema sp.]
MQQKNASPHRSIVSSVIASVCILAYISALAYAAIKIYTSIDEYQSLAEREFFNLADLSAAAGVLGFMDEPFQEAVKDELIKSKTLEGVIISGPNGEYAFEREPGKVILQNGDTLRFKNRFGLSGDPFHVPLRVEGQRNVTISAVYNYVDYEYLIKILKFTLVVVLAALTLAFFTLMLEFLLGKNRAPVKKSSHEGVYRDKFEGVPSPASGLNGTPDYHTGESLETPEDFFPEGEILPAGENQRGVSPDKPEDPWEAKPGASHNGGPRGLYTSRGNIGWEAYTGDRLNSELHRCASFEQDLVLILTEFKGKDIPDQNFYKDFAGEAVAFFTLRDLIFEWGDLGIAVIIPNMDLDQGLLKAEEFRGRILKNLPELSEAKNDLCLGLSSRAGRLIDAERLLLEAAQALKRALKDPASPIVAFKSDPEKYRAFIASQNKRHP